MFQTGGIAADVSFFTPLPAHPAAQITVIRKCQGNTLGEIHIITVSKATRNSFHVLLMLLPFQISWRFIDDHITQYPFRSLALT